MAALASDTITGEYLVWIDGNKIHCDEAKLKDHLTQILNFNENDAAMIVQQITGHIKQYRLYNFWESAAKNMNTEVIKVLLQSVNHSQLIHLLSYQDGLKYTALCWCAAYGCNEVMKVILDSVSEVERYQLLSITDRWRCTPLHRSCLGGDRESVKVILNHINQDMRCSLLQMTSNDSSTPLHYASSNDHTDVMKVIHESVTQTQWINLLQIKEDEEMTVLQQAAYWNEQSPIDTIRGSVNDKEWMQLVSTHLPEYNRGYHINWRYQGAVSRIDELRAAVRVKCVLQTENDPERENGTERVTETESLTTEQIQQLSPHSSQYIIPYEQKKSKRYGVIIFRSEGRLGAVAEADNLEKALQTTGCDVMKMEWSEATELHNMIESALSRIVADCSLLIVCLMSHGSRGALADCHGKRIPVNDILHQFSFWMPQETPLVILIQACQDADRALASHATGGSTPEPDPAPTQLSDPHRDQHITLTRPNTVLLLATVRGGVAYRGVFTGAMADQFRSADGKKDINAMFISAANATRLINDGSEGSKQIPKLESTTHKFLILPPVDT